MSCAGYSHIHYHAGTRVSLVEIKEHACSKCHLGLLYENNASNVNFNFYFFLFCRFSLSGVAVESYKTEVTSRLTLTLHDPDGRVDGDDVAYTYADAVTWASGPATQWWQHCAPDVSGTNSADSAGCTVRHLRGHICIHLLHTYKPTLSSSQEIYGISKCGRGS